MKRIKTSGKLINESIEQLIEHQIGPKMNAELKHNLKTNESSNNTCLKGIQMSDVFYRRKE